VTEYSFSKATAQHRLGGWAVDLALNFVTFGIGWFIWSVCHCPVLDSLLHRGVVLSAKSADSTHIKKTKYCRNCFHITHLGCRY
jgi:hypothetical protein